MIGTSLGPYQIESKLGEGGMGAVYLATDTRLGRKVAVKILPEEFSGNVERLARFEREARAAAALNHPHIAVVHDIGAEDGTRFIVQEYLDGADLRKRMEAGPLPLVTGLTLAAEIAEALVVAHAAGIAHRDLKPENLFVTAQGHAKVLDFGLAKLTEPAAGGDLDSTHSPTLLATSVGQLTGTAGYMAPEQISGQEVDTRADIFAFGCVLYEIAAGRRAFPGKNLPEVLHRVANEDPEPLHEAAPGLPLELARITHKCLAKEPARRYQSAADLALDLRTLIGDIESGKAAAGPAGGSALRRPWVPLAAALVGLLLGAGLFRALEPTDKAPAAEPRFLPLPDVPGLNAENWTQMALAPDGRFLAFATGDGPATLWDFTSERGLRTIGESDGARAPFFSPDSRWLGYLGRDLRLYRVPVDGGRPQPFSEPLPLDIGRATWLESGEILLLTEFSPSVTHIPAIGEAPKPLFEVDLAQGEMGHGAAAYLPDGDRVLYSYWDDRWRIGVHTLSTGTRTELTEGFGARYVPTGHMVWIQGQQLMGALFDPATLRLGEPVQLLTAIAARPGWGRSAFDFNPQGTLVYLEAPLARERAILRLDPDGTRTVLRAGDREYDELEIAPGARRIGLGVMTVDGDHEVWVLDLDRGDLVPVAKGAGWDQYPSFTSDGAEILYISERLGGGDLFSRSADGSGPETHLFKGDPYPNSPNMAPSGDIVARVDNDIWVYPNDDQGNPMTFVATPSRDTFPRFSPDGRFISYTSDRTGRREIYVAPYPEGPDVQEWKVSTNGGGTAKWSDDGRSLFYWNGKSILRAPVLQTQPFRTGPAEVFVDYAGDEDGWDISADGSYALAIEELDPPRPRLVLNWFAELERRVPGGER